MGIQNSKQDAQDQLTILGQMPKQDFDHALNQLDNLSKNKCKMLVSKWDLLMILRLDALQVKKVLQLVSHQPESPNANIHTLFFALVLSTPFLTQDQKIQRIIGSLCFEREPNKVSQEDMDFVFAIAYNLIEAVSDLKFTDSPLQQKLFKQLYSQKGSVERNQIVQFLDLQEDISKLINLFTSSQSLHFLNQESELVSPQNNSQTEKIETRKFTNKASNFENDSLAQFSQLNPKTTKHDIREQDAVIRTETGLDGVHSGGQGMRQLSRAGTLELNNSFEALNVKFNQEFVKRMSVKLKTLKHGSRASIDSEYDSNLQTIQQYLSALDRIYGDYFGQRQLIPIMKSLSLEQKLVEDRFSIYQRATEIRKVLLDSIESITPSHQQFGEDPDYEQAEDQEAEPQYKEVEVVNQSKASLLIQSIFKEFNNQHQGELKLSISKQFYSMMYFMKQNNNKRGIQFEKFQYLGQIGTLNQLIEEAMQSENTMAGDYIFKKIYKTHDTLGKLGSSKDTLIRVMQLKHRKRVFKYWVFFWQGVIKKANQALEVPCLRAVDYFKESLHFALKNHQDAQTKYINLKSRYQEAKQVLLDYNYLYGQLKALAMFARTNKTQKEKLVEDIKAKIRKLQVKIEQKDTKLVGLLHQQVQDKRVRRLYFKGIGQQALSKCASKGLEYCHTVEYMLVSIFQLNIWQVINYISRGSLPRKTQKSDSQAKLEDAYCESGEQVIAALLNFQKLKELDEEVLQDNKDNDNIDFDQFKFVAQQLAEGQQKIAAFLAQENLIIAQTASTSNQNQAALQQEKKPGIKGTSSSKLPTKVKQNYKTQSINNEVLLLVQRVLAQEYSSLGFEDRIVQFGDLMKGHFKDMNLDFNTSAGDIKTTIEKLNLQVNDYLEINESQRTEAAISSQEELLGQPKPSNPGQQTFTPAQANFQEKREAAHQKCESFLKTLASFKSSKFQKQFKDTRLTALEDLMKALKYLNRPGKLNNCDLARLDLPAEVTLDQKQGFPVFIPNSYWCCLSMRTFLRNKEKEVQWRNLIGKESNAYSFEQKPAHEEQHSEYENVQSQKDLHDQKYAKFTNMFSLMRGVPKLRNQVRCGIFRSINKVLEHDNTAMHLQKQILQQLIDEEVNFLSMKQVESFINDKLFFLNEEADIQVLSQDLDKARYAYLEKKRLKGMDFLLQGAQAYLYMLIEGQENNGMVEAMQRDLQAMQESFQWNARSLKLNSALAWFKEQGDVLFDQLVQYSFLVELLHKSKSFNQPNVFVSYLTATKDQNVKQSQIFERLLSFIQANYKEDIEEVNIQQRGARVMDGILSGQHLDDIEVYNHQTLLGQSITQEQRAKTHIFNFSNKIAFFDVKVSTFLLHRNDYLFGIIQMMQQKVNLKIEVNYVKEVVDEGLRHLVNIYEVYKTPISHYQKGFERGCKLIKKELLEQIAESDEGHTMFSIFECISHKGSALFKHSVNLLETVFEKIQSDEHSRLDLQKSFTKAKRDLDQQLRTFKEFTDLDQNKKVSHNKGQLVKLYNLKLLQELASLLLQIKMLYLKQEQDETHQQCFIGVEEERKYKETVKNNE